MARTYTVQDILFLNERITKLASNDRKWYATYFEDLMKSRPVEKRSFKAQQYIKKLLEDMAVAQREADSLRVAVKIPPPPPPPPADKTIILDDMKPVDPAVRRLLYKGKPGYEDEGKRLYLHERAKVNPKDRYYHKIQSSFEYGWLEYAPGEVPGPVFGRSMKPTGGFYRRNGMLIMPPARSSRYNDYCELFPLI